MRGAWVVVMSIAALGCAVAPRTPSGFAPAVTTSGNPLSQVKTGMGFDQVVGILGPPAAQRRRLTGHAFNPLAVGTEAQTTVFHYPRQGRVVFAGPDFSGQGAAVIGVEVDPNESGRSD